MRIHFHFHHHHHHVMAFCTNTVPHASLHGSLSREVGTTVSISKHLETYITPHQLCNQRRAVIVLLCRPRSFQLALQQVTSYHGRSFTLQSFPTHLTPLTSRFSFAVASHNAAHTALVPCPRGSSHARGGHGLAPHTERDHGYLPSLPWFSSGSVLSCLFVCHPHLTSIIVLTAVWAQACGLEPDIQILPMSWTSFVQPCSLAGFIKVCPRLVSNSFAWCRCVGTSSIRVQ